MAKTPNVKETTAPVQEQQQEVEEQEDDEATLEAMRDRLEALRS